LTIEAVGTLLKTIDEKAYVRLQVKYGLIRLVNTQADLCDQTENVDLKCPIEKGKTTFKKDVAIPNEVPPVSQYLLLFPGRLRTNLGFQGTYTVFADAYTKDDEPIICLEATVTFAM
jgi:hypothetical protein